ncbi:MAG: tryptophan synthase subunit alpha [Deltaproteobacteria bacterium]|nr:tryptophan synthase subunit alpha [Deltaproteobacteria bacterium]
MKPHKRSRLREVFEELKKRGGKALITFITAGDPTMDSTRELVLEFEKRGADIIELGIPFSDPMADGPTIQASSERALKNSVTLKDVLALVREIREKSAIPIVLFGYYNPIFVYGIERFVRDAKGAGAEGVLVVDLPPEESGALERELSRQGLSLIYLLTPTSGADRIRLVCGRASGFIYYVSVAGVTGARERLATRVSSAVKRVKGFTDLPVGVGFGISAPGQVNAVSRYADGVVVGSAIVNIIAENIHSPMLVKKAGRFVERLKRAMA